MKIHEDSVVQKTPVFHINSSFQSFTDRQKNVFDQLDTIESSIPNTTTTIIDKLDEDDADLQDNPIISKRQHTKQFSGKESIFKKPPPPPPRNFNPRLPDYQRHPHKWTKYSLDDVPNEDMSDRTNTSTALSFLKELELRNEKQNLTAVENDVSQKILFKKISNDTTKENNVSKATYHPAKIVMPEYVIGQKTKREHKSKESQSRRVGMAKQLKLDHLDEDDDEDLLIL